MKRVSQLISAAQFIAELSDPNLRVLDTRFELSEPSWGRAAFAQGHVPGAIYLDLDEDLSGPAQRHGGRHPLPNVARLAEKLGAAGFGNDQQVVIYDQVGSMYSARAWWLLRYMGHERVRVLNGGMAAYLAAGGALSTQLVSRSAERLSLAIDPSMMVDVEHIRRRLNESDVLILDARAPERYRGEVEPLDPKAGHIPGALNCYYLDNQVDGLFRSPDDLRRRLALVQGAQEVIVYCGSGVSAAHLALALEEAGLGGVKLYAGSWSDWSSYADLPVSVGDEEA